ncbi:MAG: hypothetical protein K2R98_14020 [Gemmataceae bacterium]|nr:hypothetical protein [Gemmataceae bacterium]
MAKTQRTARISAKQDGVALALVGGASIRKAAADCRVGERTIYRWQATLPAFETRIRDLRSAMFSEALGRLASAQVQAAEVLVDLLKSDNENVRRQTSRDLCNLGLRAHEVHGLTAQVAELRHIIEQEKPHA